MNAHRRCRTALAVGFLLAPCQFAAGITLNQVDSFQTSTDNWLRGTQFATGGPTGVGDGFLQISSGSFGGRPKLITFNQTQWTGDYATAGIAGVRMSLKNFGPADLPIRITIRDQIGGQGTPGYSSTNPFMLSADGQWHTAQFNLTVADMTAVNPFGAMLDPLSVVLGNVADFRLLSSTSPSIVGDAINAQIGVDEITALPPALSSWTGASSTNWADIGNWTGAMPGAIGGSTNNDTANFINSATHSPLVVDAARNLRNITFDTANVNSLVVGASGGQALLLTAGGAIRTTATVINPQTINAPLLLGGDYTFDSSGNGSSATLNFGGRISPSATSGTTTLNLTGSSAGTNTLAGALVDNGGGSLAVVKDGNGEWILSGANAYSGGTSVVAGTLRFEISSGSPTIAAGATATVSADATLELAGSISALSSGAARTAITNDSAAPGLLVSGVNQQVGGIDGAGTTEINSGSDLTADHIVQTALVIDGNAATPGHLTITASDSVGDPLLGGFTAALTPADPIAVGSTDGESVLNASEAATVPLQPDGSFPAPQQIAVPEPSSSVEFVILLAGAMLCRRSVTGVQKKGPLPSCLEFGR